MKRNPVLTKALSGLGIVVALLFICFIGSASIIEGYNVFAPYADTEFAPDYTPEKFELVREGMTIAEVKAIIGEPLFKSDGPIPHHYDYTSDGYLRKRKDNKYRQGDLAWYRSTVTFDSNGIAVAIDKGWSED